MTTFRHDGVESPRTLIYVCAPQPADTKYLPPIPLANIFADPDGQAGITQPIIVNESGRYSFYAAEGQYTVVSVSADRIQKVMPNQRLGAMQTV
jgi:hypothetical protein